MEVCIVKLLQLFAISKVHKGSYLDQVGILSSSHIYLSGTQQDSLLVEPSVVRQRYRDGWRYFQAGDSWKMKKKKKTTTRKLGVIKQ